MIVSETALKDCFLIEPTVFNDERGYFFESFNSDKFNKALGVTINFVQDNESLSTKGVLRGLHYQTGPYAQAKLVRVIKGEVLDVAVDLRPESETFGMHVGIVLNEFNKKQLFIPKGFAHGFIVLSDLALFSYKCDNYYHKPSEAGILYNDPDLNIDWRLREDQLIISAKDQALPLLKEVVL